MFMKFGMLWALVDVNHFLSHVLSTLRETNLRDFDNKLECFVTFMDKLLSSLA